MSAALEFRGVDVVYPRATGREGAEALRRALAAMDAGAETAQIAADCGVTVAVRDASLAVAPGEICVVMGLSGSGKSTLLRTANGLTRASRGEVLLGGADGTTDITRCDAAALSAARRRRISMVFQQAALLPWRSVEENVGLGLELRGEPRDERARIVAEKLELVGLADWAKRRIDELSGGMQQRVGLARAFATEADILLMDEPFSALDPLIRGRLQDELLRLQERVRKTILFVSHDLDEALRIGDRIAIMDHGRIVQTGAPQDIVLRPADPRVAEFVQHMNPLKALTAAMVMRPIDPAASYDGTLPVAAADSDLQSLIRLRESSGRPVLIVDEGRVVGVCDTAEILKALSSGAEPRSP
jgi:glycine betaine/proline transport system ATP-binding protein